MRLKYSKLLTLCVVATNLCLVYFTLKYFTDGPNRGPSHDASLSLPFVSPKPLKPRDRIQSANKHIKKMVTIVFRDFYFFDTDLQASIESILNLIPSIQIIVVYESEPYPPLEFVSNLTARSNVHFVSSAFDVFRTGRTATPLNLIRSRYILIVPDSLRLGGRSILQKMLKEIERNADNGGRPAKLSAAAVAPTSDGNTAQPYHVAAEVPKRGPQKKLLIVPFGGNVRHMASCCHMNLGFANWTLEYVIGNGTNNCDMYAQKHGIFIETALLRDMPDPLITPFPEMLYVQAKIAKIKTVILPATLQDGKRLFSAFHNKKRKKDIRRQQFRDMYKRLQIKKVIRKSPSRSPNTATKPEKLRNHPVIVGGNTAGDHNNNNVKPIDLSPQRRPAPPVGAIHSNNMTLSAPLITSVEYYGCERNTRSCIGTVFNRVPFFVHMGRHTPPCCAEKLKAVVHHVLDELENVGIRYWLDNGALKSAIDSNGLSADAYEVDISFNVFDLERSENLKKCQTRPLSDAAGFHWMKATDGHYFRVLYTKVNQVGVNLLPFEMVQSRVVPNGFYGWKAKEFSAEYLHPMSNVVFLGKNVMCPNNVKEFLDLKNV